jgi:hypothetical protein
MGGITSADDRILYCCLHFQNILGSGDVMNQGRSLPTASSQKQLAQSVGRKCCLVLLTNDINLRNKVSSILEQYSQSISYFQYQGMRL